MKRRSRCEWMPMLPWPIWPLAGHARLGQNVVVGSMTILLSWLCWGAYQEEVCLDPRFLRNLTPPRYSVELPRGKAASDTLINPCVWSVGSTSVALGLDVYWIVHNFVRVHFATR